VTGRGFSWTPSSNAGSSRASDGGERLVRPKALPAVFVLLQFILDELIASSIGDMNGPLRAAVVRTSGRGLNAAAWNTLCAVGL
jgi:hypothetical protein